MRPRSKPKPKAKPNPNKVTAAQKVERDAKVVALRVQGKSWLKVAEETGLSDRHCREIWSEWTKQNRHTVQNLDPLDVALEMISRLDSDIELLADIATNEKEPGAVRVGAVRAKDSAVAQQMELLQALKIMPQNLGKLQVELEVRYVIQALMTWAEDFVGAVVEQARLKGEVDVAGLMPEAEERLLRILRRSAERAALPAASSN